MTSRPLFLLLLLPALLSIAPASLAEVFKCVEPDGTISFSNSPYCAHKQAYAEDRDEPLLSVTPEEVADAPPGKIIEVPSRRTALPDLLEHIGQVAGISVVPIALEGLYVELDSVSHHWLELFNHLALEYKLDYRQAYDHFYIYQVGSMGQTIVHSPHLLRWYQSDETWNVVMKNDDILLNMKVYENSLLEERLRRLVKMVQLELGEEEAVNAAESVTLNPNYSGGVGGGIIAEDNREERIHRAAREKARRITSRRQGN